MAAPLAQIVDVEALLSVIAASLVAGVSLALLFSLSIASATRAAELRRGGRPLGAVALGAVAVAGLAGCAALVAFGLQVMVSK